jgi:hypothetical protein
LKVVTAGIKVLERKSKANEEEEYRLVQDGIDAILPHITTRKVMVTCQDFCNLMGGGLVSFATLSAATLSALTSMSTGALICVYEYDAKDVLEEGGSSSASAGAGVKAEGVSAEGGVAGAGAGAELTAASGSASQTSSSSSSTTPTNPTGSYFVHAICWRGQTRTINVMCGKKEVDSLKHQLQALRVLRPKISAPKKDIVAGSSGSGGSGAAGGKGEEGKGEVKVEVKGEVKEEVEVAAEMAVAQAEPSAEGDAGVAAVQGEGAEAVVASGL